jgi:hypothetical protein
VRQAQLEKGQREPQGRRMQGGRSRGCGSYGRGVGSVRRAGSLRTHLLPGQHLEHLDCGCRHVLARALQRAEQLVAADAAALQLRKQVVGHRDEVGGRLERHEHGQQLGRQLLQHALACRG